jgi:glycerol-3-phosphate acyltransferase PlsY
MKVVIYIAVFNFIGVILSVLYGMTGGSGGETTTGVFLGIAFTGLITIVASSFVILFQFDVFKSRWYWTVLLITIGIIEVSIIDWRVWFS